MAMIKTRPNQRRQLPLTGPLFFWRASVATGAREGLVVIGSHCHNLDCPCRDAHLTVYRAEASLRGVDVRSKMVAFAIDAAPEGTPPVPSPVLVLNASVDLDTGVVTIPDSVPPERRDEQALAWLLDELDGEALDHLATQSLRAKGAKPLARLKLRNYEPGTMVAFGEAFLQGRIDSYIIDGRRLDTLDVYCPDPGCPCGDLRIMVDSGQQDLDAIVLDLTGTKSPRFDGPPVLRALWQAIQRRYPDLEVFRRRAAMMKELGRDELAPRRPAKPEGPSRNQPCPCGSGKKYKRCCIKKTVAKP